MLTILTGDCREVLKTLPDASANCCVTSPPYYGLRSYLPAGHESKSLEIGREETPEEYIDNLVAVFREVRRVLRDDGVLWLNLADSSVSSSTSNHGRGKATPALNGRGEPQIGCGWENPPRHPPAPGYKPKDLIGIPWMAAFALRADGWYLRSEVIWDKPNPMPESVTDRPTRAHETVFLLTKQWRYWYDHEAVKEPAVCGDHPRNVRGLTKATETPGQPPHTGLHAGFNERYFSAPVVTGGRKELRSATESRHRSAIEGGQSLQAEPNGLRNLRDVWRFPSGQSDVKHYAMMPPEMAKRCILSGCPSKVCAVCGAPWMMGTERTDEPDESARGSTFDGGKTGERDGGGRTQPGQRYKKRATGLAPACKCGGATTPGIVLDPFGGSGTTGKVAIELGRRAILCELNPEYVGMIEKRTQTTVGLGL